IIARPASVKIAVILFILFFLLNYRKVVGTEGHLLFAKVHLFYFLPLLSLRRERLQEKETTK
ncbi:MAG: hypothetical protein MSA39_01095, partial [Prevotella sp.]|nr:hypothetical protein [Prevotella sp.]MDD7129123.1 hypothetical protein [Prevotella sp.]